MVRDGGEAIGPDVASAGLHVSDRIARDAAARVDLEEALEASRYASHPYSAHPKDWPPSVEVVETKELPPRLVERYNTSSGEGTALCGIFSEIHRAWASVDNSLFVWRYDKWDGQCQEYNGEEQAICAVGLARAKPKVFVEAIQYVLILATPIELIMLGVCCTNSGNGDDPYAEITLQPLPEYTLSSDGITMTCITCTDKGRIFLSGRDGHIYELQYCTGSGWQRRCQKICLTSGIGSLFSKWVLPNAFKFGTVDPIIDMVFDDERNIIYARTEGMKLQIFDLGANGAEPLRKIAEEKNLIDPRDGNWRSATPRAIRASKPSIISIVPLSRIESKGLHAVVVLSDGKRLFLSTSVGSVSHMGLNSAPQRPTCLKIVATRPSPPLSIGGSLSFVGGVTNSRTQPEDMSLKVEAAYYSAGNLIMSDSSTSAISSILSVQRDSTIQAASAAYGVANRSSRALKETVSSLPIEGRMLCASDVFPPLNSALVVQSLYADAEFSIGLRELPEKACIKLWAKGDLAIQHILPRRRIVVFNTMGLMHIAFNRPVDILRKLFENNAPRLQIEDFFGRFGSGEAAAMCLILAAKLLYDEEHTVSNMIAEKASEAFEDPGLVGMPKINTSSALSNTQTQTGGFNMGQVVQEAEPLFSGAYEGLCLCSSRLLFPVWEFPVMVDCGDGVVICRLSSAAMKVLENKIRSLEFFLRSRRNKRRGLYGYIAGQGEHSGSILYKTGVSIGSNSFDASKSQYTSFIRGADGEGTSSKKQRPLYTSTELAAMEVRAMECLRRLLRRSGEAMFLLQLINQHNVARLVQTLDENSRKKLVQLTFYQFVCSEEGDQLAMRLISALMEHYVGPDGRGTVDEMSMKFRDGCPSYFNESDYNYYLAVERLEKAVLTNKAEERESLGREALNLLTKIPDTADLRIICRRFENIRFYEAVVRLPLQKAQALDPGLGAMNVSTDPRKPSSLSSQLEECYEIVTNAIRNLKGAGPNGIQGDGSFGSVTLLDQSTRNKYIRQIIQLSVQWPDVVFHEYLYQTLIELGLENELLELGGSDLVTFLQTAGRKQSEEVGALTAVTSAASQLRTRDQSKYLDLLARYYVLKGEHYYAARILYMLAERQSSDAGDVPSLEQRYQYLSRAVLQAKSSLSSSTSSGGNDGMLDMLEAKLTILRFQIQIKQELELLVARGQSEPEPSGTAADLAQDYMAVDPEVANSAAEKAKDLSQILKSITQLYNEYAVPFQLWEICLEMLNFANYSGEADSKVVRETWARLLDQALLRGGVAEACSVVKRVGSRLSVGDGVFLPLDTICLQLEKAAQERLSTGAELVGDDDVAKALLAACRGSPEAVLVAYDQLLSNGVIVPSLNLKLRLLRSALAVLREWATSVLAQGLRSTTTGASLIYNGAFALNQQAANTRNQGIRDKIISFANRYMTDVRRLPLSQAQTEEVYRGFRDVEENLLAPSFY